ncbi:MAG: universal stress protein [Chloroflexi bacterium]|nr:universal stress protein [Chloroflexota bacterium]
MFRKILVPLDGSDLAEGVLPYASQLAKSLGIPLVLFSVGDPEEVRHVTSGKSPGRTKVFASPGSSTQPYPATAMPGAKGISALRPEPRGPYASQMFEKVEAEVRLGLERVVQRLESEGVAAEASVAFGDPAEEIMRFAKAAGCDLIALSTHGRSGIARGVLGSVTDKIVHASDVPTLTIAPRDEAVASAGKISRLVVPLDGSELAELALPYAERLARSLDLDVILVRTVKSPVLYAPYSAGYPYYVESAILDEQAESEVDSYLGDVSERLSANGLRVKTIRPWVPAAMRITEAANDSPGSLVVMATHGRSGLTRWVLGSVTEAVVRTSGAPVMIVPSEDAA